MEAPAEEVERMFGGEVEVVEGEAAAIGGEGEPLDGLDGFADGPMPGNVGAHVLRGRRGEKVVAKSQAKGLDGLIEERRVQDSSGRRRNRGGSELGCKGGGVFGGIEAMFEGIEIAGAGAAFNF